MAEKQARNGCREEKSTETERGREDSGIFCVNDLNLKKYFCKHYHNFFIVAMILEYQYFECYST